MFRHPQKKLVYLFILLVPVFLFLTQPSFLLPFKTNVVKLIAGPLRCVEAVLFEFKKMAFYHQTFDEYKRLNKKVDILEGRLVGMDEVTRENNRLSKLLQFKRQLMYSSVAANVIGRDPSRWHSSMMIDRGSQSGIKEGMAVVSPLGVVGKIAEVGKTKSKVILLTDPQFSVAALVQEPRESGLVSGTLQGFCRMRYLRAGAPVKVGDQVITSKLSLSFPEGLLIGEIISVTESDKAPSVEYLVRPSVAFSQIEEVLVILN